MFCLLKYLVFMALHVYSQEEYSCVIPRENYSMYAILSANKDTAFLVSNDSTDMYSINKLSTYQFVKGKGRLKDELYTKEKNKKYLISSLNDTLAIFRKYDKRIQIKDNFYHKQKTKMGWEYVNEASVPIINLEILWNDSIWSYSIKIPKEEENVDLLRKMVFLSLPKLAKQRMPDNSSSDDDWIIWSVLGLTN